MPLDVDALMRMRLNAQATLTELRPAHWPHVSDADFQAMLAALGEISVQEALDTLARLEAQAATS